MKKRLKLVVALSIALLSIAYGVRVWSINDADRKTTPPTEHYAMNEWVDLSGFFLHTADQAPTGYLVRVTKAELLTPAEYVERYGVEKDFSSNDSDRRAVVCLDYEIKHVGDGEVGIVLFEQRLIADSKNMDLTYDRELWWEAEPVMKNMPGVFGLLPDSTFTTPIPFSFIGNPASLQSYANAPRREFSDTSFELLLSNLPIRKVVDIEL